MPRVPSPEKSGEGTVSFTYGARDGPNPLFLRITVESLVYAHQQEYYAALQQSTQQGLARLKKLVGEQALDISVLKDG